MLKFAFALIALNATLVAPAIAQENNKSDWDKIVLEDKAGNVMTSTGGDYQTAYIGKLLVVGEHMMLGDATKAKVVYYELDDEGKVVDKCVRDYTEPDTYIIDAVCTPAVAWLNGGHISGANAGVIAGAAVIGAALLNSGDSEVRSPISRGAR